MKRIRTIIIAVLVILVLMAAVLRLEIELPDPVKPTPTMPVTDITPEPMPTEPLPDIAETPPAVTAPPTEAPTPTATPMPDATEAPVSETPAPPPAETPVPVATPAPTPEPTPVPTPEPPEEHIYYCTVEIRCDTVTDTSKLENEAVIPFIPADGTILGRTKVEFTPGETAFDVLKRATRDHGIHLEFRQDNVYTGGINIEGIGFLYDHDAGPLSGWMYKVNEQFPNKGTAGFVVSEGDALVWVYTCDLGMDVGDNSIW